MVPAISSLRVYALNPQDHVTPIVVLALSLGPAAYEIVSIGGSDISLMTIEWLPSLVGLPL